MILLFVTLALKLCLVGAAVTVGHMDTQYGRYFYLKPNTSYDFPTLREECISRGWYPSTLQGTETHWNVIANLHLHLVLNVDNGDLLLGGGTIGTSVEVNITNHYVDAGGLTGKCVYIRTWTVGNVSKLYRQSCTTSSTDYLLCSPKLDVKTSPLMFGNPELLKTNNVQMQPWQPDQSYYQAYQVARRPLHDDVIRVIVSTSTGSVFTCPGADVNVSTTSSCGSHGLNWCTEVDDSGKCLYLCKCNVANCLMYIMKPIGHPTAISLNSVLIYE